MTIRVLSVPARHPYVDHLAAPGGDTVHRIGPPGGLDLTWIDENATRFDVAHVHAGLEAWPVEDLRWLAARLRTWGRPLVVTVHDLPHPHHPDPVALEARLDVLVPAAEALVAGTVDAAREVLRRWGRTAHILPHPHVVDVDLLGGPRRSGRAAPVVGLRMRGPEVEPTALPVVTGLAEALRSVRDARLRVDLVTPHDDRAVERLRTLIRAHLPEPGAHERLDLRLHRPGPIPDLGQYLGELDVLVLHRSDVSLGTWLEACFDLGVPAVAPERPFYSERSGHHVYRAGDQASLERAVRGALAARPARRARRADRLAERSLAALAHRELYAALLEDGTSGAPGRWVGGLGGSATGEDREPRAGRVGFLAGQ